VEDLYLGGGSWDWPLTGHKQSILCPRCVKNRLDISVMFSFGIREKTLGHHWPFAGQWPRRLEMRTYLKGSNPNEIEERRNADRDLADRKTAA
jgi:hypothetical protein